MPQRLAYEAGYLALIRLEAQHDRLTAGTRGVARLTQRIAKDLFEAMVACLPWRDLPTDADRTNVRRRFEAISREEAGGIFELWRAHAFRKRVGSEERTAGAA